MENELVSVIIPCYNAEEFVGEAIESALYQDYSPTEIIVIDDGSDDCSLDVINSFTDEVTWRNTPNRGAATARNEGLRMAGGEFVKFLDADDVLTEEIIEQQVDQIREECAANQIPFGDIARMNAEGENVKVKDYRRYKDRNEASVLDLLEENIQTAAPLHRREDLVEVGGFDEDLWKQNEYDLHIRLCAHGVRFRYFKGLCCYCRVHGGKNRLSNREPIAEAPDSVRTWIRKRIRVLRTMFGGELPENIRVHLAHSLWTGGRRALRAGHEREARRYFEDARRLHREKCVDGSLLYRMGVRIFGPTFCEYAKEHLRPY
jgi:glycosyltransferase involved in cell wall biosynthesis